MQNWATGENNNNNLKNETLETGWEKRVFLHIYFVVITGNTKMRRSFS